jgi:hypothetical protein
MQSTHCAYHAFRLLPGQDLRQQIEAYVRHHAIEAGWIATCVGSLTQAHLRFANQEEGTLVSGHFEIVSLTGTVSVHGVHLHVCISDSSGKTIGGHLLEGSLVYTTAEVVLGESREWVFRREADGSTPWKELQVQKK